MTFCVTKIVLQRKIAQHKKNQHNKLLYKDIINYALKYNFIKVMNYMFFSESGLEKSKFFDNSNGTRPGHIKKSHVDTEFIFFIR